MLLLVSSFAYYTGGGHPQDHRVTAACEACALNLNSTLGAKWMGCVVDQLLAEQAEAQSVSSDQYFPIVPHVLDPFEPEQNSRGEGRGTSELLRNLLRNYSCDFVDGGSQPLRSMTWEYRPADMCAAVEEGAQAPFTYKAGFLPAGNDLKSVWSGSRWLPRSGNNANTAPPMMTVSEAQEACLQHKSCSGFTYSSPTRDEDAQHAMHFKTSAEGVTAADGWHTHKRRRNDCRPGHRRPPLPLERYQVDVLREEPPVYVVRDFVTPAECEHMTGLTIPKMERSVVFGGGQSGQKSSYRQSYSVNMYPDYDDEANPVTRVVRRKFAFAREVAEYEELIEGEGQEPLNSVYYKDWDDQYRPHCDGECHGGPYRKGGRIATSLTYCEVAEQGGYTLFTRSGLKIVPHVRDMLFFGYKLQPKVDGGPARMDHGQSEHSGCPLRKGTKWIATMWYREGMTAENDWTKHRM